MNGIDEEMEPYNNPDPEKEDNSEVDKLEELNDLLKRMQPHIDTAKENPILSQHRDKNKEKAKTALRTGGYFAAAVAAIAAPVTIVIGAPVAFFGGKFLNRKLIKMANLNETRPTSQVLVEKLAETNTKVHTELSLRLMGHNRTIVPGAK